MIFFFNPAVYKTMWKKFCRAEPATYDNMAHAHCMPNTESTNTNLEYVILTAFPLQQWLY